MLKRKRPRLRLVHPLVALGLVAGSAGMSPAPAAASPGGTVVSGVVTSFDFGDFSDTTDIELTGVAAEATLPSGDPVIRLTSSVIGAGAAWRKEQAFVEGDFSTTFEFSIDSAGALPGLPPGGDGFAFVLQNQSATAIGTGGCELGYGGILRGLAVEFDTFKNDYYCGLGDTSANQVSVHLNQANPAGPLIASETSSIASTGASLPVSLQGGVHTARIEHKGGFLLVFVDDMVNPVIHVEVDLAGSIDLDGGRAWIGFTASDASSWANFDIRSWSYQGTAGARGCVSSELSAPVGGVACVHGGTQVCTDKGWHRISAGCGEATLCSCAGVSAPNGQVLVTTRCGARACAGDHRIVCTEDDWLDTGAPCTGAEIPEMKRFPEMKVACGAEGKMCGRNPLVQNGRNNVLYSCPGYGMAPTRAIDCDDADCTVRPGGDFCSADDGAGSSGSAVVDPGVTCQTQTKGMFCGGNHMNGGDPDTLYVCDGLNEVAIPQRGCSLGCMPSAGTGGDLCKGPVSLVQGGADADCTVRIDDQNELACPKAPGCYGTDAAPVKLHLCGKHLINLMAELPASTPGAGARMLRLDGKDAANKNIDPSSLYICDGSSSKPRLAAGGAQDDWVNGQCVPAPNGSNSKKIAQSGCRSRDVISANEHLRDGCCTAGDPRCDLSHSALPAQPDEIGGMAACMRTGTYCGSNLDNVQYGADSTLYTCENTRKNTGEPPKGQRDCAAGCLIGGGAGGQDACVPTCNAAGAFCGAELLPGTSTQAVAEGAPGQLYYCAAAGTTPLRIPCSACDPGGPGSAYALSLAPGANSSCKLIPFCMAGEGLFCGGTGDVLTGESGTLYQCAEPGRQATPTLRCGAGMCDAGPPPLPGMPAEGSCALPDKCPPGTAADGTYNKRVKIAPYDKPPYTDSAHDKLRYFCNGHVFQARDENGQIDHDPRHLYACAAGGADPVLVDTCDSGCELDTAQLDQGDHYGCHGPDHPGSCHQENPVVALPSRPDVLNYSIWGNWAQDRCRASVAFPPQSCQLGPTCAAPSATPLCGNHGVTCGRPDVLYACDDSDPDYPLAKPVSACASGSCAVTVAPAADHCAPAGQQLPLLCTNPVGQPGFYCGGNDVQGGQPGILYYCDYPSGSTYPVGPIEPEPLAAPGQPEWLQIKSSRDCSWYIPQGQTPPSPLCLSLPGHADTSHGATRHMDVCNNPAAALAGAWKWWESGNGSTRVYENSRSDTYDTDMNPHGAGVVDLGGSLDVQVTFPHLSAYLGTVGDRKTAEWGYAPMFLDMTTRKVFWFFHLRHPSDNPDFAKYDPQVLTPCQLYQPGTVVGYMGGGNPAKIPQDAATGYSRYSSAPHFCVQYSIVPNESPGDTWSALVGSPASPPPLSARDLEILSQRITPAMRAGGPCASLVQAVSP